MEKKFVCGADGRKFATKAALAQHQRDAHGNVGLKSKAGKSGRQVRTKVRPAAQPGGISPRKFPSMRGGQTQLAQPQLVRGTASVDRAMMSGVDRLFHTKDVKTFSDGAMIFNLTVVPSAFKRLARAAGVFQKIVYRRLRFRVEPQVSAATSGGYVAGFLNDPDDSIRNLDQLTSVGNSVTTKWWQAATVEANPTQRELFTAHGPELREFSPGVFVLMADGAATQTGSLTVFCEWAVEMHGSIVEAPPPKVTSVSSDVYVRNGHQGLWVKVSNNFSDKATDILGSTVKAGDSFRLPYPISLLKPNDNTVALHHYVYVKDGDSVFLGVNYPTDYYEASYTADNVVITAGTIVEKYQAPAAVSGEAEVASSSGLETTTPTSLDLASALDRLTTICLSLDQHLARSSKRQVDLPEPSASTESSWSTLSPLE